MVESDLRQPAQVLDWMLAIQGQDFAGAKWSLGLRAPGSTDADVEIAFATGSFVRTWAMRGTLHLVNAADVHWLLALLGPNIVAGSARRYRELELDKTALERSRALMVRALEDSQTCDRKTLMSLLEQEGISTAGQRAPYMLAHAALTGSIYQSAVIRNEPLYSLLPYPKPEALLTREEALAELARRYFVSRGPATLADFVWWSGLSTADARLGLRAVQKDLLREQIAGSDYWWMPGEAAQPIQVDGAFLLPGFDEYCLSYKDRRAILDVEYIRQLTPKNGMLPATIIVDGLVSGVWKRVFKKGTVEISASPAAPLTAEQRESLATAAERFGAFLQVPVILNIEAQH
jgi:hypothetical protein